MLRTLEQSAKKLVGVTEGGRDGGGRIKGGCHGAGRVQVDEMVKVAVGWRWSMWWQASRCGKDLTEAYQGTGWSRRDGEGWLDIEEGVDVRKLVEDVDQLNRRICEAFMRLAAIIESRCGSPSVATSLPSQEGERLSTLIHARPPEDLELNIQALLQAMLVSCTAHNSSSWNSRSVSQVQGSFWRSIGE